MVQQLFTAALSHMRSRKQTSVHDIQAYGYRQFNVEHNRRFSTSECRKGHLLHSSVTSLNGNGFYMDHTAARSRTDFRGD